MKNDMPLVNRVANSGLITINLEDFFPAGDIATFDLKDHLFMGLILKEKDFREALKQQDWSVYQDRNLLVYCSADAIIPVWAYMLVVAHAAPYVREVFQGDAENFYKWSFQRSIDNLDVKAFENQKIVIKGCSEKPVPPSAYVALAKKLHQVAYSIMYGEPCSTVPIYKKK